MTPLSPLEADMLAAIVHATPPPAGPITSADHTVAVVAQARACAVVADAHNVPPHPRHI